MNAHNGSSALLAERLVCATTSTSTKLIYLEETKYTGQADFIFQDQSHPPPNTDQVEIRAAMAAQAGTFHIPHFIASITCVLAVHNQSQHDPELFLFLPEFSFGWRLSATCAAYGDKTSYPRGF